MDADAGIAGAFNYYAVFLPGVSGGIHIIVEQVLVEDQREPAKHAPR